MHKHDADAFVRNSSFMSRDGKDKFSPPKVDKSLPDRKDSLTANDIVKGIVSPPKVTSPVAVNLYPKGFNSPPITVNSYSKGMTSPPIAVNSTPKVVTSPPITVNSSPKGVTSPPITVNSSPKGVTSPPITVNSYPKGVTSPPITVNSSQKGVTSPPITVNSSPKGVTSPPIAVNSSPKGINSPKGVMSPSQKEVTPPKTVFLPPRKETSPPKRVFPPPRKEESPPKTVLSPPTVKQSFPPKSILSPPPVKQPSPPKEAFSPPKKEMSPPKKHFPPPIDTGSDHSNSVAARANMFENALLSPKEVTSPPAFKLKRTDSKIDDNSPPQPPPKPKREDSIGKEIPTNDKLTVPNNNDSEESSPITEDDSNGVGDKIKKFERAAEDAGGTLGRVSRAGSVRGKSRIDRLGSDEYPPPATPFKDTQFDLCPKQEPQKPERQKSFIKNTPKWQRSESHEDKIIKPEPQKIIKPEFKAMPPPADVTIRSPSLGAKIPDRFPSQGTAFRNVGSPDQARNSKLNDDVNTQNNSKQCKFKDKKYSVSKGSSYFTRGSEEIWLVKKKDIEEIEERVYDSFRRAGGNMCMRNESVRPSSDSGQGASFAATLGRNKRQMYARSESLDPQHAQTRAQTLKRQTSVACTCGHDKKTRAKSTSPATDANVRLRSRSQGDDNQGHVLDKYETLV